MTLQKHSKVKSTPTGIKKRFIKPPLLLLFIILFSGMWLLNRDAPIVNAATIDWDQVWPDTPPAAPGSVTIMDYDGTGVDIEVTYSDFMNDGEPGIYQEVSTPPVPPLATALRWTNNQGDTGGTPGTATGPVVMEVIFSEPVLLEAMVVGSLSELTNNRHEWVVVTAYDENDNPISVNTISGKTYRINGNGDYIGDEDIPGRPFVDDVGNGEYRVRGVSFQPSSSNISGPCTGNDNCGYDSAIFDYGMTAVTRVEAVHIVTVNTDFNSARSTGQASIVFEPLIFTPLNAPPPAPGTAVLGNCVWLDENGDGLQNVGEPGISNVLVQIEDTAGGNAQTITDADGCYLFEGLAADTYTVSLPTSNFNPGGALEGLTQTENPVLPGSDYGNQTPPYDVTLADGETNLSADFGFNRNPDDLAGNDGVGSIGDRIWVDLDEDGAQDPDEIGLEGVTVQLVDPATGAVLNTAVTDPTGNYRFDDLAPGGYTIIVDDSTLPTGYVQTGDPDHYGTTGLNDNQTTSPIVLAPGDVYLNADFGYSPGAEPVGRLGNKVWFDTDNSGTMEEDPLAANEFGIAGVTVALLKNETETTTCSPEDGLNPIIATTETDGDGMYIFEGLPLDDGDGDYDYIVWVNDTNGVLAGLTQTYDFDDTTTPNCSVTTLDDTTTEDLDQDFSYTPTGMDDGDGLIGDTIYFDRNGNATQNADEPGLAGVLVTLDDGLNPVLSTVTDENGRYIFADLDPTATYTVTVDPANFTGGMLDGLDNTQDPDGVPANSSVVDLNAAGPVNLDQDFGYTTLTDIACVGNLVWLDPNSNGSYEGTDGPDGQAGTDDDEPAIGDVTLELYRDLDGNGLLDAGENVLDTAVTTDTPTDNGCFPAGDLGNYIFVDIPAGNYIVRVTDENNVLLGYWHSIGIADTSDESQPNPYDLSVAAGTDDLTADFGYYVDGASVGNRVWLDLDEDGEQDDTEPGVANVPVVLTITYPNAATAVLTTTTDINGVYSFDNLLLDEDFNGIDPTGEPTYEISMPNTPAGFTNSPTDQAGGNDQLDSDDPAGTAVQPVQGITDMTPQTPPTDEPLSASVDFGLIQIDFPEGAIGNTVWLDENNDGLQDPGEPGIPNVTMQLIDSTGALVGELPTDTDGRYLFDALPAGTYTVTLDAATLPDDHVQSLNPTLPNADFGNQTLDYSIVLGDDEENLTADFGFVHDPAEVDGGTGDGMLGDTIWLDDGDGVQEPNEMGIPGVTVTLTDPGPDGLFGTGDDVEQTTVTDENGRYQFINLLPNPYTVTVDETTLPAGLTPSGDPDNFGVPGEDTDHTTTTPVPLAPGDVYLNIDFGYTPAVCGQIGDTIWLDADASETDTADAGEDGLVEVTVALIQDSNGNAVWDSGEPIIADTVTDGDGIYLFPCLSLDDGDGDADYLVWVNDTNNVLAGLRQTYDDDGLATANISATALDGTTTSDLDQDFSYTPFGHQMGDGLIGDTIWFNSDGNDTQTTDEPGIEGVLVELRDDTGVVVDTAVTNQNGTYLFPSLIPNATYTVTVAATNFDPGGVLEDLTNTADRDGNDDDVTEVDLNADGPIVLDADFGYTTPAGNVACLGDLVWLDATADGLYDNATEDAIEGVTVDLYRDLDGDGLLEPGEPRFGSQTTAANTTNITCFGGNDDGNYIFDNIPADDYIVVVSDRDGVLNGYWTSRGADATSDNSQQSPYAIAPDINMSDLTADFGYYKNTAAIGNRVWIDLDNDGIQDGGEPPLPGAEVTLVVSYTNATVTVTDVTDADGMYSFGHLLADEDLNADDPGGKPTYTVSVTPPLGYAPTDEIENPAASDLEDSNDPAGTAVTPQQEINDVSLAADPNNEPIPAGYDFGFQQIPVPLGAIGNTVWLDEDNDGLQDPGEPGIANVTVTLLDSTGATVDDQQTDTNGGYLFDTLPADTYTVTLDLGTLPAGLTQSTNPVLAGADFGNQSLDYVIVLGDAEENLSADFGFIYDPADVDGNMGDGVIGDTIWLDDGDGVQEPHEMGIADVTVTLTDPGPDGLFSTADDVEQTTVTDDNGRYQFIDLPPGPYTVTVDDGTLPANLTPSGDPDNFGVPGEESDHTTTIPIPLAPGDVYLNIDFGYEPPACGQIGDMVWFDADASGTPTAGVDELGIEGVTVALIKDSDGDGSRDAGEPIIATTVTDADGIYLFPCLSLDDGDGDADYLVWVNDTDSVLQGLRQTYDDDGTTSANISPVALDDANPSDLDQDFSYTPTEQLPGTGLIGDTVWLNSNGDNVQDPDEPGLEGVIVEVRDDTGALVDTAVTNQNGQYSFPNLDPTATYTVTLAPENFIGDGVLVGLLPSFDRDGSGDLSTTVDLNADGPIVLDADFGLITDGAQATCLGDLIWLDSNADGLFNNSEDGIEGVTVDLYRDLDGDGLLDVGEPRFGSQTTQAVSNITCFGGDDDGNYLFDNIPADTYIVVVSDRDGVLNGYWHSEGMDGTSDNSQTMPYSRDVTAGVADLTADFGYYKDTAAIGNTVWEDEDDDGIQDDTENSIEGAVVTLTIIHDSGDTVTVTDVTDADGMYSFGHLLADEDLNLDDTAVKPLYTLTVETPPGFRPTSIINNGAVSDFEDSEDPAGTDVTPEQGVTDVSQAVDPNNETTAASYDFGFVSLIVVESAIGNYVWLDEDADGLQDAGEAGIPNVTVELQDDMGVVLATQQTDSEGRYLFDKLMAGTYVVAVDETTLPAGLAQTTNPTLPGADFGNQTNPYTVILGVSDENLTADFGYVWNPDGVDDGTGQGTIGDTIWLDGDGDGRQDPTEPGIPGVALTLLSPGNDGIFGTVDDQVVATTTTDETGSYQFTVDPGVYQVVVDDINFDPGQPLESATQTGDPDEIGQPATNPDNLTTTPIILAPGDTYVNADFGYQPAVCGSIGDTVWFDVDASGADVLDSQDFGIGNVTIALLADAGTEGTLDAADVIIATATTAADGSYLFSCLPLDDGDGDADYLVMVTDNSNVLTGLEPTYDDDGVATVNISATALDATTVTDDLAQDFSYTPEGHTAADGLIGDTIYFDQNANGTQDAGEPGLEDVLVTITLPDGSALFTFTDENGRYTFGGLDPDGAQYTINVDPGGILFGMTNTDDPNGGNDGESMVTLTLATPINLDQDFGYGVDQTEDSAIGNLVWLDENGDGVFDASEEPIGNVTVTLYRDLDGNGERDSGDPRLLTTTTTATLEPQFGTDGNYQFTGLPAGDYLVVVSDENGELNGYWQSIGTAATDGNSQQSPYAVTVGVDEVNSTADFGYFVQGAAVGNRAWVDGDGNGIQDLGEALLADVEVTLTVEFANGDVISTTAVTNAISGAYSFGNLMLDEDDGDGVDDPVYTLTATPPAGFVPTQIGVGDPRTDSNDPFGAVALPVRGVLDTAVLADPINEPSNASYDFGFHAPLYIGDRVFDDLNGDGIFDTANEMGIGGVTVQLVYTDGTEVLDVLTGLPITAVTDEQGFYLLEGVPSGTFVVSIPGDNFDESTDPLYGFISSPIPVPAPDPDDDTTDFDDNGINNLDPAVGGIQSQPISILVGDEPTGEDGEATSGVVDENSNRTVDFGFFELLTLGNRVWLDEDMDGELDPGEPGIGGVVLSLLDADGDPIRNPVTNQPVQATTTADGTYLFTNLFPGEYRVRIDASNFDANAVLEGFISAPGSADPDNNDDTDDNGVDVLDPQIVGITSLPVEVAFNGEPDGGLDGDDNDNTNLTVDFGVMPAPVAVDLVSFTAVATTDGQALIKWVTEAEVDVFGFYLYRSTGDSFVDAVQIHFEPSAFSSGNGPGATYTFVDQLPDDGDYFYWLVPIETDANSTAPHGTPLLKHSIFLPVIVVD